MIVARSVVIAEAVTATTGMPHVMVRRNMQKIRTVMADMEVVVNGLTRNLDTAVLDDGYAADMKKTDAGLGLYHTVPLVNEHVARQLAALVVVLDEDDQLAGHGAPGSVNANVEPWPG